MMRLLAIGIGTLTVWGNRIARADWPDAQRALTFLLAPYVGSAGEG
jgi:hypothetical protein